MLSARDIEILYFCGKVGYASQEQLARSFFPSLDRCRRRTRILAGHGLLRISLHDSTAPYLFTLTAVGLRELEKHMPDAVGEIHLRGGAIGLTGLRHNLAITDARQYLSSLIYDGLVCPKMLHSATHQVGVELRSSAPLNTTFSNMLDRSASLARWLPGSHTDVASSFGHLHLEPDALALVEIGAPEAESHDDEGEVLTLRYAFEIDASGTEGSRVLGDKHAKYASAVANSLIDELWWIVLGGKGRERAIAVSAIAARLGPATRIFSHEAILRRPLEAPPKVCGSRDAREPRPPSRIYDQQPESHNPQLREREKILRDPGVRISESTIDWWLKG
jgi:hypothetical protein